MMLKNVAQLFMALCGMLFFLVGSLFISYWLFSPLFGNNDIVSFSYVPIVSIANVSTYGLYISFFIGFWGTLKEVLKKQPKSPKKMMWKLIIILASVGLILNYANYYLVIKPNNMVICPLKKGYKSNLMRDYVKDLSQCEK